MYKEKIMNLLFHTNEDIDQNILSCFNQIFKIKDTIYYYCNKLEKLVEIGKNPSVSNARLIYYVELDYPSIITTNKQSKKISNNNLILVAEVENKIDKVINKIDLFASNSTIKKQNNILEIINHKIFFKDISLDKDISNDAYKVIVEDYKKHFTELTEVLDFIIACRFSQNRRASFLHMRINAGWGKTFFMTMLKEIGLLLEVNYNDFKDPCGLLPSDFINKIAIGIDEFTHFKSEFKKMANELQLTPKFGFKSEVEVFAKLFFSAEESKSFTIGVTKQILDRVNLLDKNDYKARLEDRSVYKQYGVFYREVLIHYINNYFKKEFDTYIAMGKLEADKKAFKYLNSFNDKYKIESMEIEEYFKQIIYHKINDFLDSKYVDNFDLCKQSVIVKDESIYIVNPAKFFKEITLEEDEHMQRSAKFLSINSVLNKTTQRRRLDKILKSFIEIKISEIKDYIEKDEADEEFRLFEESLDEIPF